EQRQLEGPHSLQPATLLGSPEARGSCHLILAAPAAPAQPGLPRRPLARHTDRQTDARAMALAASLAELQAEASCPVCLDALRDPVTLECGHNCCGPCLRGRWEGLGDVLPCPHREKLKRLLEPLRKQVGDAERGLATQTSKIQELQEEMEARRSELYFELEYFKGFLGKEHRAIEIQILRTMSVVNKNAFKSRKRLLYYLSKLKSLLSAVTAQRMQTDLELLRGVGSIHFQWSRCVNRGIPEAYLCSLPEESFCPPTHYVGLQTIMSKFQAHLTLDPETAHRNLTISPDRRAAIFTFARMGPDLDSRPKAFTSHEAVLSAEGFQAGRHFWQVDVRGAGVWCLGVCAESFPRDAPAPPSPSNGCWHFQRSTGSRCHSQTVKIRVGVFLDYELGVISFYNLSTRSHLCTLTGTFTDRLFPYFAIGPSPLSFSMNLVTEEQTDARAMALAASLAELQAEASCPVCLDALRDPVTLECGHNCCGPCLRGRWEGLGDVLPCPVCQHHCPSRDVRRNPALAALADLLRRLPPTSSQARRQEEEEEEALCAQHRLALALFCEEDLQLLCARCAASSPHRGHPLTPVEQAAAQHREKLKRLLEPLRKQVGDAERGLARQTSKIQELREQVDARRRELYFEFAHFKGYLNKERDVIDTSVLREISDIYQKVADSEKQMSDYGSKLKILLRAVTTQLFQTDLGLLTGIANIQFEWNRCFSLEVPATYQYEFLEETCFLSPKYVGLQTIMSKFQAHLTLDPETAHRNLTISPDRRAAIFTFARMGPDLDSRPKAFTSHEAVLSAEGFQAGRHFWQVDVRGAGVWCLGVCAESFPRDAPAPPSPSNGCWHFQRSSRTHLDPQAVKIRVGVFLDYELGVISFYNLSTRSHLCTLTGTFIGKLFPYFSLGPCSLSFSMTLVNEC
ncbi:putative tripartite motif-containing protein 75, partial [Galemys pyrenaicus]